MAAAAILAGVVLASCRHDAAHSATPKDSKTRILDALHQLESTHPDFVGGWCDEDLLPHGPSPAIPSAIEEDPVRAARIAIEQDGTLTRRTRRWLVHMFASMMNTRKSELGFILLYYAKHSEPLIRYCAAEAVGTERLVSFASTVQSMRTDDLDGLVRARAYQPCAELHCIETGELLKGLVDPDWRVRQAVICEVMQRSREDSKTLLKRTASFDESAELREWASAVLENMDK